MSFPIADFFVSSQTLFFFTVIFIWTFWILKPYCFYFLLSTCIISHLWPNYFGCIYSRFLGTSDRNHLTTVITLRVEIPVWGSFVSLSIVLTNSFLVRAMFPVNQLGTTSCLGLQSLSVNTIFKSSCWCLWPSFIAERKQESR